MKNSEKIKKEYNALSYCCLERIAIIIRFDNTSFRRQCNDMYYNITNAIKVKCSNCNCFLLILDLQYNVHKSLARTDAIIHM